MKKIFNKKNLKKALTYTAVAIGGAVVTIVACTVYGNKLEKDNTYSEEFTEEEFNDKFPDEEFKEGETIKVEQQTDNTWKKVESFEEA